MGGKEEMRLGGQGRRWGWNEMTRGRWKKRQEDKRKKTTRQHS